jgi:hypothetical protein
MRIEEIDGFPYGLWTTDPPKVEGWYWTKSKLFDKPFVVDVRETGLGLGAFITNDKGRFPLDVFTHWLGPLPIPEPPL